MPPDPVGQRERSRARPPLILGARAMLARLTARCASPMPPDPVGQRERSRARPPLILGARAMLARLTPRCASPVPPVPVGQAWALRRSAYIASAGAFRRRLVHVGDPE